MNSFFNNNNNNNANLFLPYTEIGASCHWSVLKGSLKHMHLMSTAPWSSLALKQSTIKKKKKAKIMTTLSLFFMSTVYFYILKIYLKNFILN
jgi:hypothetical protein